MICVAVPMASGVDAECLASLWGLARFTKLPLGMAFSRGIYTPLAREDLAVKILASDAKLEAIAWIDSDMGFTPEDFEQLVHDGRRENAYTPAVVGGYYPSRKIENQIVGRPLSGDLAECWSEELREAESLGGGFLYVPRQVYEKVPRPWYDSGWRGAEFLTEDVFFCRKVREKGVRVLGRQYPSLGHAYETRRSMRILMEGG